MSIDILDMGRFAPNNRAFDVAFPVMAIECEATPPIENHLDAYEEAVLKLISIGLSAQGIATAMNATQSLIEVILGNLELKEYVVKERGQPWRLTGDGHKYLDGTITERASKHSQYGYMFVNAIKKSVLPFFYQGDINQVTLFGGRTLPAKLTLEGDEEHTFQQVKVKGSRLREAYRWHVRNQEIFRKYGEDETTFEEAFDEFAELESLDEMDEFFPDAKEEDGSDQLPRRMFIRALNRPQKRAYLRMRIIIDPSHPGGYRVESPFDFSGLDNDYFLRQIQWFQAAGTTYIGEEALDSFLDREIRKIVPTFSHSEKDYTVFLIENIPRLRIDKSRFPLVYDDMSGIYSLMQCQSSLLDKENVVSNMSKRVVERLFNAFFRELRPDTLHQISVQAKADLQDYGVKSFLQQATSYTEFDVGKVTWGRSYVSGALGRIGWSNGNSIVEKLINIIAVDYYVGTTATRKLLTGSNVQRLHELSEELNVIRRKVSHDTDEAFDEKDYDYYMNNVFELVNGLLEALGED